MAARDMSPSPSFRTIEVGARVELIGELGTYLVVRIDRRRHCADLMLMGSNARMEFGIHFSAIRPISKAASGTERRDLHELSN